MPNYYYPCIFLICSAILCVNLSFAQESNQHRHHIFEDHELLKVKFEVDIGAILADRGDKPEYHEGTFSYKDDHLGKIKLNVKARARGNFRRNPHNCVFPPLHIKFNKKEVAPTIFHDNKKLKLVTHCQEEESIIREYLIYCSLNLFTPFSFKARLVRVTYKDIKNQYPSEVWYAFFIEDAEDVAARNGGSNISEEKHDSELIDQEMLALMHFFHAMIGNLDWDISLAKNLKFIEFEDNRRPIALPYDFDWSAAVGASYTQMEQDDYEQRRYRPFCNPEVDLQHLVDLFKQKKEALFSLYRNCPYLSKKESLRMLEYVQTFYEEMEKADFIEEKFLKACGGRK